MELWGHPIIKWLPAAVALFGLGGVLLAAIFGPKGRPGGRG